MVNNPGYLLHQRRRPSVSVRANTMIYLDWNVRYTIMRRKYHRELGSSVSRNVTTLFPCGLITRTMPKDWLLGFKIWTKSSRGTTLEFFGSLLLFLMKKTE